VERLELSLVIPAFDEARRLPGSLRAALAFLEARGQPFEVIVVDDGSRDDTAKVATEILAPLGGRGRLLRLTPNRGKGAAVRTGVLAAHGELVLVSDADLSAPLEELEALERAIEAGADVAIGSRALDRRRVLRRQSLARDWSGRLFNLVVRLCVLPGIHDTQCGFKLFRRAVIEPIFARARIDGFGFDVETLAIAEHLGFRITEVPVRWQNDADSRVGFGQGAMAFIDPLRVRLGLWLGRYGPRGGA
jgi:dolichyl-phosphate beta-glucosyltransferase